MDIQGARNNWLKEHPNKNGADYIEYLGRHNEIKIDWEKTILNTTYKPATKNTMMGIQIKGVKPHKCPVCDGRGEVSFNFYYVSDGPSPDNHKKCRSCKGEGVLWST